MTTRLTAAALAAMLLLGGSALAQSYGADDGSPAVTEPGGTMGRDGADKIRRGVQDGEAVGVPRGSAVEVPFDSNGRPLPPGPGTPR